LGNTLHYPYEKFISVISPRKTIEAGLCRTKFASEVTIRGLWTVALAPRFVFEAYIVRAHKIWSVIHSLIRWHFLIIIEIIGLVIFDNFSGRDKNPIKLVKFNEEPENAEIMQ
jgi:hypothetical protein